MKSLCKVVKPAFAATPFCVSLGAMLGGLLEVLVSSEVSDQHSSAVLLLHNLGILVNRGVSHGNLSCEGQQLFWWSLLTYS